jgi:hypothetical protein
MKCSNSRIGNYLGEYVDKPRAVGVPSRVNFYDSNSRIGNYLGEYVDKPRAVGVPA